MQFVVYKPCNTDYESHSQKEHATNAFNCLLSTQCYCYKTTYRPGLHTLYALYWQIRQNYILYAIYNKCYICLQAPQSGTALCIYACMQIHLLQYAYII